LLIVGWEKEVFALATCLTCLTLDTSKSGLNTPSENVSIGASEANNFTSTTFTKGGGAGGAGGVGDDSGIGTGADAGAGDGSERGGPTAPLLLL